MVHRVVLGDEVLMVHHDQTPATERPKGPYKVIGFKCIWEIDARWSPDIFFELEHPDGWTELRPWYLCIPNELS